MPQALIIYASLTGNTEACADILAEALEGHGVEVTLHDVMQAEAADFEDYDCCIAGAYTYGVDGVLPDEMLDCSEDLGQLDLSGKVFGVFGSGDEFYEVFCGAVDTLEEQFKKTGARQAGASVKVNLYPEDEAVTELERLAQDLADALADN